MSLPAPASGDIDGVVVCLCTCPDRQSASRIAHALVEERLAACVNLLPQVESVYRWQGVVEQAEELQLLIKTSRARLPALIERVRTLHPYECPELLALDAVAGLPGYLNWVLEETRV